MRGRESRATGVPVDSWPCLARVFTRARQCDCRGGSRTAPTMVGPTARSVRRSRLRALGFPCLRRGGLCPTPLSHSCAGRNPGQLHGIATPPLDARLHGHDDETTRLRTKGASGCGPWDRWRWTSAYGDCCITCEQNPYQCHSERSESLPLRRQGNPRRRIKCIVALQTEVLDSSLRVVYPERSRRASFRMTAGAIPFGPTRSYSKVSLRRCGFCPVPLSHSCAGRNPGQLQGIAPHSWMPVCTGMTVKQRN